MSLTTDRTHQVLDLGNGVYSVSEVCRILHPGMTPRRVHYWLDTGLLFGSPIRRGGRGYPTLLSYRQLLEIRTVQYLRDQLGFPLPNVREAFEWILESLFRDDTHEFRFARGVNRALVAQVRDRIMVIPGGQGVLDGVLPELNRHVNETRRAWEELSFPIPGRPHLVANARILGGAPTVRNTRIDTALLASFADGPMFDAPKVDEIHNIYPRIKRAAIIDALKFEGLRLAA